MLLLLSPLSLLFLILSGYLFYPVRKMPERKPTIGVMELSTQDETPKAQLLAKRLTNEIKNALNEFDYIRVVEIDQKFYKSARENGWSKEDLSLDFILNGKVMFQESCLDLAVALIDEQTQQEIWTEAFEQEINNANSLYLGESIGLLVATETVDIFGQIRNYYANNTAEKYKNLRELQVVYDYYNYLSEITHLNLLNLKNKIEVALEESPDNAFLWAIYSNLHIAEYVHFQGDSIQLVSKAVTYINKALELDSMDHQVQELLANHAYHMSDKVLFKKALQRSIDLNSSSIMLGELGMFLVLLGDYEEGEVLLLQAMNSALYFPEYYHIGTWLVAQRKKGLSSRHAGGRKNKSSRYYC